MPSRSDVLDELLALTQAYKADDARRRLPMLEAAQMAAQPAESGPSSAMQNLASPWTARPPASAKVERLGSPYMQNELNDPAFRAEGLDLMRKQIMGGNQPRIEPGMSPEDRAFADEMSGIIAGRRFGKMLPMSAEEDEERFYREKATREAPLLSQTRFRPQPAGNAVAMPKTPQAGPELDEFAYLGTPSPPVQGDRPGMPTFSKSPSRLWPGSEEAGYRLGAVGGRTVATKPIPLPGMFSGKELGYGDLPPDYYTDESGVVRDPEGGAARFRSPSGAEIAADIGSQILPVAGGTLPALARGAVGAMGADRALTGGGFVTGAGPIARPIRAYHGLPHDFDKFDMSKIGTGQGTQAQGHGLYFAGNKEVGEGYRPSGGHTYEVDIHADPNKFLDYDKPLNRQPPEALRALGFRETGDMYKSEAGQFLPATSFIGTSPIGPAEAKRLSEAGVPGIKYLDQGSRAAGDGSRNYVLFDDKIVEILRKYGVGSIAALPPAVQMAIQMGRDPEEAAAEPRSGTARASQLLQLMQDYMRGREPPPQPMHMGIRG